MRGFVYYIRKMKVLEVLKNGFTALSMRKKDSNKERRSDERKETL